jgi:hypothetical protein
MTELVNTKQQYRLRVLRRFYWFDTKSHHSAEFGEGAIVSDPRDIKMLEAFDAPVERVPLDLKN